MNPKSQHGYYKAQQLYKVLSQLYLLQNVELISIIFIPLVERLFGNKHKGTLWLKHEHDPKPVGYILPPSHFMSSDSSH
jgi:hypothetical protein